MQCILSLTKLNYSKLSLEWSTRYRWGTFWGKKLNSELLRGETIFSANSEKLDNCIEALIFWTWKWKYPCELFNASKKILHKVTLLNKWKFGHDWFSPPGISYRKLHYLWRTCFLDKYIYRYSIYRNFWDARGIKKLELSRFNKSIPKACL